jgi:hypothetical protein
MGDGRIRVYCGFLDALGISRIGYVDVEEASPSRVIEVSSTPVLSLGREGTFDDNGVMPAHVSWINGQVFLYYTGFQLGTRVRYYMFGGLALSSDGTRFARVKESPVLDRANEGLYFRGGPCALAEDGRVKLWYSSGSAWELVGGKSRPTYDIRHQVSENGIDCSSSGELVLEYPRSTDHGLGRPQVIRASGLYRMFITRRTRDMKYSIGYATSFDGRDWSFQDDAGIGHSESGWDSEMVYFPSVVETSGGVVLFYCGNEFGRSGFGYATLDSW